MDSRNNSSLSPTPPPSSSSSISSTMRKRSNSSLSSFSSSSLSSASFLSSSLNESLPRTTRQSNANPNIQTNLTNNNNNNNNNRNNNTNNFNHLTNQTSQSNRYQYKMFNYKLISSPAKSYSKMNTNDLNFCLEDQNKSDMNNRDKRNHSELATTSSSSHNSNRNNNDNYLSTVHQDGKRSTSTSTNISLFKNLKNGDSSQFFKLDKRINYKKDEENNDGVSSSNGSNNTPLISASTVVVPTQDEMRRIVLNSLKEYHDFANNADSHEQSNENHEECSENVSNSILLTPISSITNQLNNLFISSSNSNKFQPVNQNNLEQAYDESDSVEQLTNSSENDSTHENSGCSIKATSSLSSSSMCCRNHFCHQHSTPSDCKEINSSIPITCYRQQQLIPLIRQRNSLDLGMSSIQATTIISNHCNTEVTRNAPGSFHQAVTTLTSSSSGLPVTALTVMESPKLSSFSTSNKVYNWQALMPTVKARMATIFNCELLADVHFLVGRGSGMVRFPAHKFVLSIGSAVFDAMFNGPLSRANQKDSNDMQEIELPDVEPDAFKKILRFLYLDEVEIESETVMTTLYVAKKYEVTALEMACVDFLKANLTSENAFMLLTQARLFDETALADLCLETIDKHTLNTLCSESFLEVDLDTLKLVLNRDTLRAREVSLFKAVLRWTEFECQRKLLEPTAENRRKVLGNAIFLIRFPLMSIKEFAMNVAQSGLLTDKEMVNLFIYYTVTSKPSVPFSIEPRCCITGEECTVNRFSKTHSRWGYSGTSDRIRFKTDRSIFVIGFGLFGSIHGPSEYSVDIEIIHTKSSNVIASNTTSFLSDGTNSTFQVMFKRPVKITKNTHYTACATLKGLDSYYGINGCQTVTVSIGKGNSNEKVTFQFNYAAGCNNGTSVEDGQIPQIIFYT